MTILSIEELKQLNNLEITNKILEVRKILFDLKFKKATKKTIKTHLIKQYKRMLAQLLTIEQKSQ